jgi:LacI family transcriptional regulator
VSTSPTLEDVARAAGVSTATVSRALNQPDAVRPALREKVLAAVARMGYVPHAGARALTLRRSGTVGVVVPTIDNAIFARGLQAFQHTLAESGYHVLLAFSDYDPQQEDRQAQNLLARGVDALAFTGISQSPQLMARLAQRGLPWVHTGSFPAPEGVACVGFRNRDAMVRAVRYLLDLGHRRIAMLAGVTAHNDRAAERVSGVRDALAQAGLKLPGGLLRESPYAVEPARRAVRELLAQANPPTALLCGNDVLAYGALLECQALGVAVPEALSVVGFDDLDLSRHWQPGLTTMHVPTEVMWRLAAEHLLARLDGSANAPVQREIDVELVVRGSTSPCRGTAATREPRARKTALSTPASARAQSARAESANTTPPSRVRRRSRV